jgi:ABC-2 type transport system permease protein
MSKTWLIVQREYMTRVKKKSFLLTTILVPITIIGFYVIMIAVSVAGEGKNIHKVAVIDETNLFNGNVKNAGDDVAAYTVIANETEASFKSKYKKQGYDYFLYIPAIDITKNSDSVKLISETPVSLGVKNKIEHTIDKAVEAKRLQSANISPEQYKSIKSDISVHNTLFSGDKEKNSATGVAAIVGIACGVLIYMILLIYGTMVMRGVMEEKMNRIAEVIVSSVKPFQLMLGKIVGIGAVGLTQFAIWIILIGLLQLVIPLLVPGLTHQMAEQAAGGAPVGGAAGAFATFSSGIGSLPIGLILITFIFYFLGGYLLYASLFAAIGSVVSEDQQEAQQLVFPVMMPIILGFVIMFKSISDPNSSLVVFSSMFPLTSPVVMMGRIVYGVPVWQLITSMVLLILTFLFFTWLTAKIYRTGILLYGKKVTWRVMLKWAFRKS